PGVTRLTNNPGWDASPAWEPTGVTKPVGDLRVTTSTTGLNPDPDGYVVTVDGGPGQAIGINATVTFSGLAAGDHVVALGGVATNCSVGENPRTVAVPAGGCAQPTFIVDCRAAAPPATDVTRASAGRGSEDGGGSGGGGGGW